MSTKNNIFHSIVTTIFLVSLSISTAVDARQLNYAISWPTGSISADAAYAYAEAVEKYSDGKINVKVFPLTLLNAAEASPGTRDGIADIGYIFAGYYPSEYPNINFISDTSMQLNLLDSQMTKDGLGAAAFQGAISEYILFNCHECLNEYKSQNQVYTSHGATSEYGLLCTSAVSNLSEIEGKRLRVIGSNWSRWADEVGAQSVSLTINEMMEGLDQGVIDCTISDPAELINLRLIEVVSDITMGVPGGIYAGTSPTNINRDVWQELDSNDRRALLRAGAVMTAQGPWSYYEVGQEALQQAKSEGIEIHTPQADLVEATESFSDEDMSTIIDYYTERYDIANAEQKLVTFGDLLDRWIKLVQGVENIDQLTDLYWNEIFSKIDIDSYGL